MIKYHTVDISGDNTTDQSEPFVPVDEISVISGIVLYHNTKDSTSFVRQRLIVIKIKKHVFQTDIKIPRQMYYSYNSCNI